MGPGTSSATPAGDVTLRAKLVISFTSLLLAVITAVGLVASRSVEAILIGQIDDTLTAFASRGSGPGDGGPENGNLPERNESLLNPIAEIRIASDGTVISARPSGFADEPDPLPDVTEIGDEREFMYLHSVDDSLRYRAHVVELPDGTLSVRAAPLDEVFGAIGSLARTLLLAGAGVLLIGGAATWWVVDRSVRSIGEMVETAEAIAAGDLTRRVPEDDPNTELGRLGVSLNEMLAHIEETLNNEREGRERLRQFVGDASHELRGPVTAIRGYAELRRRGGLENPEAVERAWERIASESSRMSSLIEDLLMLTRLGQTQPLDVASVDLSQLARDAAADHAAIDRDRPVSVEAPASLTVEGDEQRLHQVISNLLANTRIHTPAGTSVRIEVDDLGDAARLSVVDDGPGVPDEAIPHIFDRFYRADPSRYRTSGGSGLGLAIVQAIVAAHGGGVFAANDAQGGARFTVTLPKRLDSKQ